MYRPGTPVGEATQRQHNHRTRKNAENTKGMRQEQDCRAQRVYTPRMIDTIAATRRLVSTISMFALLSSDAERANVTGRWGIRHVSPSFAKSDVTREPFEGGVNVKGVRAGGEVLEVVVFVGKHLPVVFASVCSGLDTLLAVVVAKRI